MRARAAAQINRAMTIALPPAMLKAQLPSYEAKKGEVDLSEVLTLLEKNMRGTEFYVRGEPTLKRLSIQSQALGARDFLIVVQDVTLASQKMVIYDLKMDISVTEFKAHCLDLIRQVEDSGKSITIRRRGKVVARLEPASSGSGQSKPWEELRALGGHTNVKANESAWADEDFEALG
jgi:antitoxin (DNA-binding transcriptional repressor) of toxin-antitoxin stability system